MRGAIALQTAFCILAVDFHLFPRVGAKTLTFGHSVMDLGVGAVVVAGALTRRRTRARADDCHTDASPSRRTLTRQAPLLLAAVGRLLAVRAASYHEVHSEYGVHWNFFFTLAIVAVLTPLIEPRSAAWCAVAAGVVLVLHQAALSHLGVSVYVQLAPRTSLLAANKEGLCSLPGYLALALAGSAASGVLFGARGIYGGRTRGGARSVSLVGFASLVFWAGALVSDQWVERTSRRLCNAAYVLWVLAQVGLALAVAMARDALHGGGTDTSPPPPPLLEAVNRHPLVVFLVANLLTGAVNLSMDTLAASHALAAAVLTAYMVLVCISAVALERHEKVV